MAEPTLFGVVDSFGIELIKPPTKPPVKMPPTTPTFSDVPANNVFYQFVEAASHAGAITGFIDGTFRPNDNVTRAQVAIITLRARGYTAATPTSPTFVDVPTSNFAYAAIETLAARGIINGAA